jgi:GTP-binding protein
LGFVVTLELKVKAGNGGDGKISFRREKYVPKGGPDGGDGGSGGNIIFVASQKISTFLDIAHRKVIKAEHGQDGRPRKQSGKHGNHVVIRVPCGTSVYDSNTKTLLHDLTHHNDSVVIARGGRGGRGNPHFSTARIQTPRKCTPGQPGQDLNIRLELKVIADVGLIGYPNAGKSTLLKTITQANPKIANYPFTTLHPNLGILRQYDQEIVIADIPGIIEGAANGIGLGNQFLRHISRTNVLLFLVEPIITDLNETRNIFEKLTAEINQYDPSLLRTKDVIVAINKIDLLTETDLTAIETLFKKESIYKVSCFTRKGLPELEKRIGDEIKKTNTY